jgi:hypothetical protein
MGQAMVHINAPVAAILTNVTQNAERTTLC